MIRKFFTDEKADAGKIFKNGFSGGKFNAYESYLVAKYYRNELGYKDQKIKSSLISFCQNADRLFNYAINRKTISEVVKNSNADWKNKSNKIFITKSDLENISKLKDFNSQKVFLAFVVFSKRDGGYVYKDRWTDIKRLSNIRISDREIYSILHKAYNLGLIRDSNQNHFIGFLENSTFGEIVFSNEKDIFKLSDIYKTYLGGEIGYCKSCEKQFIKNGRGHKFCEECSFEIEKVKNKERVKKHRKNRL